ncbi:MAG: hypothetical protein K2G38_04710 [Clostridia bacterium]|nr:hypothetical protein [Clostridia bacterium]
MDVCKMAAEYGLDTLLIAAIIVVFTGVVKIPIKRLAQKTKSGKKFTKFITLIPIVSGFGITALVSFVLTHEVKLGQAFIRQWLAAVSLSLAIYAFWEKFAPSKKAALLGKELEESKSILDRIKSVFEALPFFRADETAQSADEVAEKPDNEPAPTDCGTALTNAPDEADGQPSDDAQNETLNDNDY